MSLLGCDHREDGPRGFISAPAGEVFADPTWLASRGVVVVSSSPIRFELDDNGFIKGNDRLRTVELDSGEVREITLRDEVGCARTEQRFPFALSDGRVAYLQDCVGTRHTPEEKSSLRVWDPADGESSRLLPFRLQVSSFRFSFSADGERGVINVGGAGRAHLATFGPNGLDRLPLDVADVHAGTLSPDGESIALVAVSHLDAETPLDTLYVASADGSELRPVVTRAKEIRPPAWSADSRRFAVVIKAKDGSTGIWLVDRSTGTTKLLKRGSRYDTLAWLPDGKTLVATVGTYEEEQRNAEVGLEVIRVPDSR